MKKLSDIAASLVPPFEACVNCFNGFVPVEHWRTGVKVGYMKRCSCWYAHQARIGAKVQAATRKQER